MKGKVKILFLSLALLFVIVTITYSQTFGPVYMDILSYDYSTSGLAAKVLGLGMFIPNIWIGIGTHLIDEYGTIPSQILDSPPNTVNGICSIFPIDIYLIPFAKIEKLSKKLKEKSYFLQYVSLYGSYSSWAFPLLSSKVTPPINSTLLNIGINYTFPLFFLQIAVKAGYMKLNFPGLESVDFSLQPYNLENFYLSAGISISTLFHNRNYIGEEGSYIFPPIIQTPMEFSNLVNQEKFIKAEQYCDAKKGKERIKYYKLLAKICFQNEYYLKAGEYYEITEDWREIDVDGIIKIADAFLQNQNYDKAIKYYEQAGDKESLKKAGAVYLFINNYDATFECYSKAGIPEKDSYKTIADAAFSNAQYDIAAKYYAKAGEKESLIKVGDIYLSANNYDATFECYSKAGIPEKDSYKTIADAAFSNAQYDIAAKYYAKAGEKESLIKVGDIYLSANNYNAAFDCYSKAGIQEKISCKQIADVAYSQSEYSIASVFYEKAGAVKISDFSDAKILFEVKLQENLFWSSLPRKSERNYTYVRVDGNYSSSYEYDSAIMYKKGSILKQNWGLTNVNDTWGPFIATPDLEIVIAIEAYGNGGGENFLNIFINEENVFEYTNSAPGINAVRGLEIFDGKVNGYINSPVIKLSKYVETGANYFITIKSSESYGINNFVVLVIGHTSLRNNQEAEKYAIEKQKLLDWVNNNTIGRNEDALYKDIKKRLEDFISINGDCGWFIGWGLTKSQKPYTLIWKNGYFNVQELTMEKAKEINLSKMDSMQFEFNE